MRISDWSSDVCSSDLQNRVAVACFASNVARLETVIQVAEDCGRRICLLGRSMHRIVECARESGYLLGHRPFVSEEEVDYLPRNEVLLLCTGSRSEEHTSELQSLMRSSYAVFCLKKKT